ncbi:unannotated protein [freshwater metagenome]|uniref:Unannotated protein n=1 Tax=freshwater metagenome TaxID=449393 RepID=A0A6J7NBG0_9ZZZZ
MLEHDRLGLCDAVPLLVLCRFLHRWLVFVDWHREPVRLEQKRVHPPTDRRNTAYRHELSNPTRGDLGDAAQASVHGDHEVVRAALERTAKVVGIVRIVVQVRNRVRRLGPLVCAAMQDGDVPAAIDQALHDVDAGRTGSTDDERSRPHANSLHVPTAERWHPPLPSRQCIPDPRAHRALYLTILSLVSGFPTPPTP